MSGGRLLNPQECWGAAVEAAKNSKPGSTAGIVCGWWAWGALASYGRIAVTVGGAVALAQVVIEIQAYKQSAENFASLDGQNQVAAFFATNAIDRINVSLFNGWTIVLLGVAPILLGLAGKLSGRRPAWHAGAGVLGGTVCLVSGSYSLVQSDQAVMQIPFLVGSLLVTLWVLAEGVVLWRLPSENGDPQLTR